MLNEARRMIAPLQVLCFFKVPKKDQRAIPQHLRWIGRRIRMIPFKKRSREIKRVLGGDAFICRAASRRAFRRGSDRGKTSIFVLNKKSDEIRNLFKNSTTFQFSIEMKLREYDLTLTESVHVNVLHLLGKHPYDYRFICDVPSRGKPVMEATWFKFCQQHLARLREKCRYAGILLANETMYINLNRTKKGDKNVWQAWKFLAHFFG